MWGGRLPAVAAAAVAPAVAVAAARAAAAGPGPLLARGRASLTLILRPIRSRPFRLLIAASASERSGISREPNPLDWPVTLSLMMVHDETLPIEGGSQLVFGDPIGQVPHVQVHLNLLWPWFGLFL